MQTQPRRHRSRTLTVHEAAAAKWLRDSALHYRETVISQQVRFSPGWVRCKRELERQLWNLGVFADPHKGSEFAFTDLQWVTYQIHTPGNH